MKALFCTTFLVACYGQIPTVRPQVVGRAVQEGQVTTVYLAPRFATAIRMPDAVNSVVLGDPDSFSAEHSEKEPQIVFVKPITIKAAQTNLLISTARGYQANLLLISRGETRGTPPSIDFLMRYRPAGRFIIEPSLGGESASIAQTAPLESPAEKPAAPAVKQSGARSATPGTSNIIPASYSPDDPKVPGITPDKDPAPTERDSTIELDALLERQRKAPLPPLYGESPGIAPPGKELLKAGVSEVLDQGRGVVVLFSVLDVQDHAVELMPPQIQLAGKVKKGAIVKHKIWSNSEQLPVEEFRMSRRRLGPGERADGVVVFERPRFKQSNETLLLQIADSGAVDRPALAPIGFGISTFRKERGE
jgi:hypothetical protein